MAERLADSAVASALQSLAGWSREGDTIRKQFTFQDFRGSIAFVNAIADLAEAANHHPDITITYNRVLVALSTHDAGGLTQNDLDLARQIEQAPAARGA
jgi:4a-hydroxytetrahydrobiopterin dehydratase